MADSKQYTVQTLRNGQPRPYADTEREYLITCLSTRYGMEGLHPFLMFGDVEATIKRDEAMRAAGTMSGGMSPDALRKYQRDWAKRIVRGLCQDFRESFDQDGRTGMDAHFYPTLRSLTIDPKAGTIRALIIEPYSD